jgi:site-specific DNA-methyltransferase (adenine-specific)
MKNIPDGSVDLVLTDPPYGTVKNLGKGEIAKQNGYRDYGWDETIDTEKMFQEISRVLRPNGKAILFSQEPYTSHLITSQIPSLPFSYRAVWVKNVFGNKFTCNKAMVNKFEDVCLFTKPCPKFDFVGNNPNRIYFKKVLEYIGFKSCKQVNEVLGHRKAEHCFYVTGKGNGSTQFSICTEQVYNELIDVFGIDKMQGFIEYSELKPIQEEYQEKNRNNIAEKYPSVFNLWQGGKSKSNVLEYAKDNDGYHPTQKPVKLLEDLIQTYSNEGNTVLDFTMGSGSTGVACINTNRNFIGIELDKGYFDIAEKRINEAQNI